MLRAVVLGILAIAPLLLSAPNQLASAQEFPQRTVTVIVPSAPGGTLDALARFFAQAMGPALGRSVVVENVSGAGGLVGLQRLTRAEPDGHTIVFGNMGVLAAAMALNPDSGFDPRRDLAPIGVVANVPMVLAASPASGIRSLPDLIERIRRHGERVSFGTAGSGTTSHLAPGFLLHLTGLKATLVGYRGSGPAMNDLAAGVVDAVIDQTVTMIPAHRGGQAVAIAVSASRRIPQLPDVPTFAEGGVPSFDMVIWNAFAAPRGTPDQSIARLQQALEAALAEPDLQRRLADLAATAPQPEARGPDAMRRLITAEVAKWTEFVRLTGLPRD